MNRSPLNSDRDVDDEEQSDRSAAESIEQRGETTGDGVEGDDGEFGDDFDDFEEGGDGDDFGDFDDGFQQGEEQAETTFDKAPDHSSIPAPSLGPVSLNYSSPDPFCFGACVLK